MAIDLIKRNQCHNFIIIEKSSSVGGTWHDNKYPGCCCDVWSVLYSYSFEQNPDWTRQYPGQEEILVRRSSTPLRELLSTDAFIGLSPKRSSQVQPLQVHSLQHVR